ncbi:MAG: hypothetical protein J1F13_06665, partial [Prevotellaceae bacterium]|nr:hypothetical protein [Prevotellaceae bacterium]
SFTMKKQTPRPKNQTRTTFLQTLRGYGKILAILDVVLRVYGAAVGTLTAARRLVKKKRTTSRNGKSSVNACFAV